MKAWTTDEQYAWLTAQIPQWNKRRDTKGKKFVQTTTTEFLRVFHTSEADRLKLPGRIRQWFHNHSKKHDLPKPTASHIISLKARRKIVPLKDYQAYSRLFYKKGSSLYEELQSAHKSYIRSDKAALDKYRHLFPPRHNPNLPFVAFQQAVLRDKLTTISDEELLAIEEFISTHHAEQKDQEERPWNALKIDEVQSEFDLERQYVEEQVSGLPVALEAFCDEVKDLTNFKPFIICGGPCPKGTGSIEISHAGSGESVVGGQTFQQYLGQYWEVLKTKYTEWLNATYSHDELLRLDGSVNGPSTTHSTLAAMPSSLAPTLASMPSSLAPTLTAMPSSPASIPQRSPSPETTLGDTLKSLADTQLQAPVITTLTPEPTTDESDGLSLSPSRETSPAQTYDLESSPPPCLRRASSVGPPALQAKEWIATHEPSWSLGPQHHKYVCDAIPYLTAVPGGPEWEKLLASFITFESLSSSRPGSCKLPVKPRPDELSWWFKNGRPLATPKSLPQIESIQDFEDSWVKWWLAIQPKWRGTGPAVREEDAGRKDWGDLPNGGKDGLFLVVISLGWWIHARAPSRDSRIDTAIADVTWVIDHLVSLLSAEATDSDGNSAPDTRAAHSPMPPRKRSRSLKIGPPPRGTKRARG